MSHSPRKVAFVLVASDQGAMIVNRLDYHQTPTTTYGVGHSILERSSYQPAEVDWLVRLLQLRREVFGDGAVAIDCGANIGGYTIPLSKAMTTWGSVIAIEAQERIFYALAGNIVLNNCFNVRAVLAAVTRANGEMRVPGVDYRVPSSFGSLELKRRRRTEFIGQPVDYENPGISVRTMTLDSLALPRVDLIKMDIEGMELEALDGCVETLTRHKPILYIETIKTDRRALTDRLRTYGYEFTATQLSGNMLAVHGTDTSVFGVENVSCEKPLSAEAS